MQQRLSIRSLSQGLQLDPFFGNSELAFEMAMKTRQRLLEPPMTFPFINKLSNLDEESNNGKRQVQPSGIPWQWQAELLHTWCGLERLATYEPQQLKPTGWFCWEYHEHCHVGLEVDRDEFRKFLRKKSLPLPSFWYPDEPDNSKKWKQLGPNALGHWAELKLLGQIDEETKIWEDTPATNVTERLEKERQLIRLQKQRAAVLNWLNPSGPRTDQRPASPPISGMAPMQKDPAKQTPWTFRKEGDFWCISYEGKEAPPLKDSLGLRYIAFLLSRPQQEMHVAELSSLVNGHRLNGHQRFKEWGLRRFSEDGLTLSTLESSEPVLDGKAKTAFKKHLHGLSIELEEARRFNDLPRMNKLQAEKEAVEDELRKATGLGGKNRKIEKFTHEKIRKAVTNRIRAAMKKLKKNHPPLGQHLSNTIHTGMFCSYCPEKPVSWHL